MTDQNTSNDEGEPLYETTHGWLQAAADEVDDTIEMLDRAEAMAPTAGVENIVGSMRRQQLEMSNTIRELAVIARVNELGEE